MVKVIQRMLSLDHEVEGSVGAQEAIAWISAGQRYDVILCDLMMPRMTGMDFYSELQRIAPEQAKRVIFLTGGAFTPRMREFLDEVDDKSSPMKAKGVAELGICGVAAAVANAIYNATGVRVRDYPITLDKLLDRLPEA